MDLLKKFAEDLSSLLCTPFIFQQSICVFEIGRKVSLILEAKESDCLFISACYTNENSRENKDIFINVIKLTYPLKSESFFCKTLLLKNNIVISISEKMKNFSCGRVERFKYYAMKTLVRAGAEVL